DRSLDQGNEMVAAGVPGDRRATGTGGGSLMETHGGSSDGPHARTLVDMLRLRAKLCGGARVYSFLHDDGRRESLTFGELDRRARAIAQRLSAQVGPGDRVLLLHPSGLDYAIAF